MQVAPAFAARTAGNATARRAPPVLDRAATCAPIPMCYNCNRNEINRGRGMTRGLDTLARARRARRTYEQWNLEVGHENAGFLSEAHGYLPKAPPLERLDAHFSRWDEAAAELPVLYRNLGVRRRLESLPVLDASQAALPDAQVLRACALLAVLAHAYWYSDSRPPSCLPTAINAPWAELRARLGRSQPVLSYIDLVVYNWRP